MIDEVSYIRLQMRDRRANITENSDLLRSSAARRKTFAAAMQQFEEQLAAARVVTPATSPINLYYGLMQAGLAIVASRKSGTWTYASHGLRLTDTTPDLPEIRVTPHGNGAFQAISSAINSEPITSPVSIGRLWASLPDLVTYVPLRREGFPPALYVRPGSPSVYVGRSGSVMEPLYNRPRAIVKFTNPRRSGAQFGEIFADYPSAKEWQLDSGEGDYALDLISEDEVKIAIPGGQESRSLSAQELRTILDDLAPEYRYLNDRYMRPSVEDDPKPPPAPVMSWWLLLYSFSMLARYQPRKWNDLLDLDKPGFANQLIFALELAQSAVPHLLIEALDGAPLLFPKPSQQDTIGWF